MTNANRKAHAAINAALRNRMGRYTQSQAVAAATLDRLLGAGRSQEPSPTNPAANGINRLIRTAAGRNAPEPEPAEEPRTRLNDDGETVVVAPYVDMGGGVRGTPITQRRETDFNSLIRAGARAASRTRGGIDLGDLTSDDIY